ncbi:MAG: hypothetical protein Q8K86_11215 [Candidatus Nanopelagicaceae bacterium]|nr:hypothetical protein [Candidatus Nanopelagicaceae bacterium]
MKKLVVFDLDGTLAESKSAVDPEMIALLNSLLLMTKVAVISGAERSFIDSPRYGRKSTRTIFLMVRKSR